MRISSTNLVPAATLVATVDNSVQDINNVKDFDFSTKYSSAGTAASFVMTITFAQAELLSYVALAGHTLLQTTEVRIDGTLVGSYTISDARASCQMFFFTEQLGTVVELTFTKTVSSLVYAITHIAAGKSFDVPNSGEISGYSRMWLSPSKKQQVVLSDAAGPISIINKSIAQKGTLSIPNMPKTVAEGSYRNLTDFMMKNAFFILEQDTVANSAYLCFDTTINPPKAHAQTRELVNASVSFVAYTGN